jgi:hypothetical protein
MVSAVAGGAISFDPVPLRRLLWVSEVVVARQARP